jgi:hypothetical protein
MSLRNEFGRIDWAGEFSKKPAPAEIPTGMPLFELAPSVCALTPLKEERGKTLADMQACGILRLPYGRIAVRFWLPDACAALFRDGYQPPEDMVQEPHSSPRPHLRRGHAHTVLFGIGRRERRAQWYPAVFVNGDPDHVPAVRRYVVQDGAGRQ